MLQFLLTYTRQRFNLLQFSLLALYLLLYAAGGAMVRLSSIHLFVLLLAILYGFRLFDDLASKEVDASKADRVYTLPQAYRPLLRFCLVFTILALIWVGLFYRPAGLLLLVFVLLNGLAYFVLFYRGQWRFVLPLLKYPFLCFLLVVLVYPSNTLTLAHGLVSLSLLPVFLLFEALSDPDFKIGAVFLLYLGAVAHGLLLLSIPISAFHLTTFMLGLGVFWYLLQGRTLKPYRPYLVLLYFLTLRLLTYDAI